MILLNGLLTLSRSYCVGICSVLVPLILLITIGTIVGVSSPPSRWSVKLSAVSASVLAGIMVFHVTSWFVIGVVRVPTYVLTGLACLCLGINSWALSHPASLLQVLHHISIALPMGTRKFRQYLNHLV